MRIAILTISDRASRGEYEDRGGPAVEEWLRRTVATPMQIDRIIIADGFETTRDTLVELCDSKSCDMVLTTGGTGPAPRDLTPEATQAVLTKELPGFGELMRRASLEHVATAILSRQTAGVRGTTFILNLPGSPGSIGVCLNAVFAAVPYCLELIGAGHIDTDPAVLKAHWPGR
ncbi:molybdopterin adenylyltransferase [Roseibium aggregatum]|uniref:Molybdopterin adenylyltransferase n=1 Tax=Roseibium aggregatum TaxID=187304 RepID=A0A939EHB3_9HYPH|nr:molybdopterin adenylyltransferase [Roseibium aggregatum]MBN9672726.1 molybdopterin adenylyltransferase [Roseibium aggregatum]